MNKIGIIREYRIDDNRAPLTPSHIKELLNQFTNLNKIEVIYGTGFRDALENILFRMETGTNRIYGKE